MDLTPESMGYDRAIVVFSPDGRLFQVEYAREAVKKGSTIVGIKYKDGVVFAVKKKVSKLVKGGEKIYKIDKYMGAAISGFVADARILVDIARVRAQQHKLLYDEYPSVVSISKYLADRIQAYTQYAGVRPYGVSLLIGGISNRDVIELYQTDPSGVLLECEARAVGKAEDKVNDYLEKNYKEGLDLKSAITLAWEGLKLESKIKEEEFLVRVINKEEGYKELNLEDIKNIGVKL